MSGRRAFLAQHGPSSIQLIANLVPTSVNLGKTGAQLWSHLEPTGAGDNSEVEGIALFLSCWIRGENCDKVPSIA